MGEATAIEGVGTWVEASAEGAGVCVGAELVGASVPSRVCWGVAVSSGISLGAVLAGVLSTGKGIAVG